MGIQVKINPYWGAAASVDLTDLINFNVLSIDGLGMAPVKNILQTGPLQQGSTRVDYKLQPRIISLVVDAIAVDLLDLVTRRDTLLRTFTTYSAYALDFIVEWDTGGSVISRHIDVYYNGQMTMASKDKRGYRQKTVIELIAPFPIWRSDSAQTLTFNGLGAQVHTYVGSWEVHPWQVRITGPKTDPCITVTHADGTSEKLDFTGITIGSGHYYDIDLRYEYRKVRDETAVDKSGDLTVDSDLSTFCIKKTVDSTTHLVSGWNEINVTGGPDTGVVVIQFFPHYIGI